MLKKQLLATLVLGLIFSTFHLLGQVQLTNIPTIYINTVNGAVVNSETVWVPGFVTVASGETSDVRDKDTIEIRNRGNSTWWSMPKKSFRIKFNEKRHLLNMKANAKDWVLLANYADKTLIHNAVAFEIGQFIGMEFTPSVRFADVFLNNVFLGNYMVTDQIEAGKNRVNVESLTTTDITEPNVTGGYAFQRDGFYTSELVNFLSNKSVPFSVTEPDADVIQPAQKTYLVNFVNTYESKLFSTNWMDPITGYRAMLDSASFFKWYIASELTSNVDCFWSTYMYKRRNDIKLYYGPLWDYDIAFDNCARVPNNSRTRMLTAAFDNKTWITKAATDPWFKISVNNVWKGIVAKGIKSHLQTYVDSLATLLDASQKMNYNKWGTLSTAVYDNWYTYPTYLENINVLKNFINIRVDFLTTSFEADASSVPVVIPPIVPVVIPPIENYYYSVSNKTSGTLMDLQDQSTLDSTRDILNAAVVNRLSQQWKLVAMSDGSYQFINRYSNRAMRSNGLNHTARLFTINASDTRQRWKIVPTNLGNGIYKLVNVSTGNVLETSGSTVDNTLVNENIAAAVENTNQAWFFQKMDALPVGLNDVPFDLNLQVGPNPVSTQLFVHIDGICPDARLDVFDLRGTRLLQQQMNNDETTLNVQDLSEGMYILRFTAGQQCKTVKFLVKHGF